MSVYLLLAIGLLAGIGFLFLARNVNYAEGDLLSTGLLLAAAVYVGFAVLWGQEGWVRFEAVGVAIFSLIAFLARRFGLIWIGAGWLLHVGWDYLFHMAGPGAHLVPNWYPPFCIGFDIMVGAYILWAVFSEKKSPKSAT